jgi:hypothetical protein
VSQLLVGLKVDRQLLLVGTSAIATRRCGEAFKEQPPYVSARPVLAEAMSFLMQTILDGKTSQFMFNRLPAWSKTP